MGGVAECSPLKAHLAHPSLPCLHPHPATEVYEYAERMSQASTQPTRCFSQSEPCPRREQSNLQGVNVQTATIYLLAVFADDWTLAHERKEEEDVVGGRGRLYLIDSVILIGGSRSDWS